MFDIKAFIKRNLMKAGIDVTNTQLYKKYRLFKQADGLIKEAEVTKQVNALYVDRFLSNLQADIIKVKQIQKKHKKKLSILLFSFDRAFQLYALLSSVLDNFQTETELNITVLYRVTNEAHANSYTELKKIFEPKGIEFVKQADKASFKSDLLKILKGFNSERVMFLVDDIVITSKINLDQMLEFDSNYFVPSLRLGKNIKRNYTLQQEMKLPPFMDSSLFNKLGKTDGLNFWRWKDGDTWKEFDLDWRYVVSVDGNIFNLDEMIIFSEAIEFKSPNVFENLLYLRFSDILRERIGICFDSSKMVNLPINQVHVEGSVNIAENIKTPDYLLQKWQEGFTMDYKSIYGHVPSAAHEELDFKLVQRHKS
jgi:hypothetical protein